MIISIIDYRQQQFFKKYYKLAFKSLVIELFKLLLHDIVNIIKNKNLTLLNSNVLFFIL